MQVTILARSGSCNIDKATKIAEMMNEDDDWSYKVIDCKNGLGRIDVFDEDGELVHKGFVV